MISNSHLKKIEVLKLQIVHGDFEAYRGMIKTSSNFTKTWECTSFLLLSNEIFTAYFPSFLQIVKRKNCLQKRSRHLEEHLETRLVTLESVFEKLQENLRHSTFVVPA